MAHVQPLMAHVQPLMAHVLGEAKLRVVEARQLSVQPCVACRAKGQRLAQLADGVQLLESGRPGQCGDHAAVPGGSVLCSNRHAGQATSGDA